MALGFEQYGQMLNESADEYGLDSSDPMMSMEATGMYPEQMGILPEEPMHEAMPAENMIPNEMDMKAFFADFIRERQLRREKASLDFQEQQKQMSKMAFGGY